MMQKGFQLVAGTPPRHKQQVLQPEFLQPPLIDPFNGLLSITD